MLRDLDFDFDFALAGVGVAGGPTGSGSLLLDLAGLADAARFGSNLGAAGGGSILGAGMPRLSAIFILFNSASLMSLTLADSVYACGGGGIGGVGCSEPFLLLIATALGSLAILAPAAGGGGGGGGACPPFALIVSSSARFLRSIDLPRRIFSTFS